MGLWTDVVGTVRGYIRLGLTGVRLKNSSGALAVRNAGDSAYAGVECGTHKLAGLQQLDYSADIASGATVDLGTATGNTVTVTHSTGTTAITSLGGASLPAGTEIETIFSISGGTLTITHHPTNLYLAGGASITLANGDTIRWKKMHDSNAEWKMVGGKLPASQADAEAGTDNGRDMTPLRVAQAIAALAPSSGITLGTAVASTSGTSIDFTGIPSGTKRITINFAGVSTSGTASLLVQIGTSGGIATTGYSSGGVNDNKTRVTSTAGFILGPGFAATASISGRVTLELLDAATFTWVSAGLLCDINVGVVTMSDGSKSLSAELGRVRITTVGGTNTFGAGEINITYES